MAPQTIFVLDQRAKDEIASLHRKIDRLTTLLSSRAPSPEESDWFTAQAFCERYSMGRTTLARRLAEEPCRIETLDAGGKKKLYRWRRTT